MPWNDVECDLGGDETCNFGPRKESGSLLYQVNTLATISSTGQAADLPLVSSSLSAKGLCVAADRQVSVFEENCQRLLVILSFESVVELIKWSHDATFLIIAERNGTIHFAHSGMGKILYSQTLVENSNENQPCFQGAELCPYPVKDDWNFLALTRTTLFRFPKINFTEISTAIETGNMKVIKEMMVYDTIDVTSVVNVARSLAFYTHPDCSHLVITGTGQNLLAVWKLKSDGTELSQCIPSQYMQADCFQKCLVFDDYIFALDDKNVLVAFDKRSLIQLARWSEMEVQDFILINYNPVLSSSNLEVDDTSVQVVAIATIEGERFLRVLSLPGMQCIYSLALTPHSFIAEMPPHFETIYLIEGTNRDEDAGNREVSTLRLRCLTEALPQTRFHRLLHQSKFAEAEEFANLFGLDLQLVHITKANYLMKNMILNESEISEYLSNQITELIGCLDNVTDERFIASTCSDVGLPNLSANQILLSYAYNRVCNSQDPNITDLKTRLLGKMKELKTFELVHGEHCFSLDKWNSFLQPTIANELMKILKASMLAPAMALCLRHEEELLYQMDLKIFRLILDSIPAEVSPASIIPWIRDVLFPLVFRDYPEGKKLLAVWVEDTVRNMEIRDKNSWPGNGINLLQIFFSAYQSHTRIGQVCGSEDGQILDSLETLLGQLTGLCKIKEKYHCYLSLQDYTQETVSSIAFVMLNRVAAIELVPRVLENQVKRYCNDNHLNLDKLLNEYIMYHCNSFESRAIAISQYITDPEIFCQSVLCLMKRSQLPWSDALEDLVQTCLKLDHPLADQVQDNYKLIELCRMLAQYKLDNIDLRNLDIVQMAIYNILQRAENSVMTNALQLVEAHQQMTPVIAYIIRITFLLKQNKLDECFELFYDLEKDVSVECAEIMVKCGQMYLSEPVTWTPSEQNDSENGAMIKNSERLTLCQATIKYLKSLMKQPDVSMHNICEWKSQLQEIQLLKSLLKEFDVFHYFNEESSDEEKFAELAEFYNTLPEKKVEVSSQNINDSIRNNSQLLTDNTAKTPDPAKKFSTATRFGKCLQLREEDVKSLVAREAMKRRNIKEAISICRDLCHPDCTKEGARVVFDVLLSICQLGGRCKPHQISAMISALGSTTDLFKTLYELSCAALTFASDDNICDLAELSKHLRLLQDIERQCETGDYGSAVEISDSQMGRFSSSDWLDEEFFSEDSMVMESSEALPKAASFIKSCIPLDKIQETPYQLCRLLGLPVPYLTEPSKGSSPPVYYLPRLETTGDVLIEYLSGNSHHQLTLMVATEVLMSGVAYINGNTIDAKLIHPQMKDGIVEELKTMKSILGSDIAVIENCASLLLDKIFEAEHVNQSLALSFLLLLRKPVASQKLKLLCSSSGYNYKKIMVISEVGQEFASFCLKDESVKVEYEQLEKLASWGQKLRKHKISFKDAFQRPVLEEFAKLLPMITANPQMDLTLILEFCRDFNLNGDEALLMYLKHCLLPNTVQYKQRASADIRADLDVCKLEEASIKIKDKILLVTHVNNILEEVDSYDYERIGFMLKILKNYSGNGGSEAIDQQIQLLGYLQVYKRVSAPSVVEVSQQTSDDYKVTDEYKDRLPFHGLLKSVRWKILSKELTDTTIEQLLPVIRLLQLPSDQVYVTTIHNILQQTMESRSNPSQKLERGKSSVYLKMLDSVQNLLLQVENLQMAVATARLVAKEIPKGPEKVVAFKICNILAEKWVQTSPENSPEKEKAMVTLQYLSEKYRFLATERVLFKYNLAEKKHLEQVNSPTELIFTLYQHQSIVNRKKGEITTVPDIHAAAETIAKTNNCNLDEIHNKLLEMWLCKSLSHQEEEDMTMDLSSMHGLSTDSGLETDEDQYLMRIRYLLQIEDPGRTVQLLLKLAYDESTTFSTRLRTLKCLFDISDLEMLQNISGKTLNQLWEHLENVSYLSKLEELNFNLDLKTFLQANKQGLVRGMLRKHSQEPKALKLIADLCLKYDVMDINLWNHLVQQMVKFKMLSELEEVLHSTSSIGELQQISSVGPAWWNMLLQPFKTVRAPLSDEERTVCRRSLILLHRCPVTCDLDVLKLKDCFCKVEMFPEALACLFHLPISEKSQEIKAFLETVDYSVLVRQLKALKDSNQLLPEAQRIEEVLGDDANGIS